MKRAALSSVLFLCVLIPFTHCGSIQNETEQLTDCQRSLSKLNQQLSDQKTEAERKRKQNEETYKKLIASLKDEIQKDEITITNYKDALTINIAERILFDRGRAEIKHTYYPVLNKIGAVLGTLTGKFIQVEGHTDDVPIADEYKWKIPNNWALGARRAINVTIYLMDKFSIDPQRIAVMSFSKYRPLVPNTNEKNRAKNRRIEIVIIDKSLYQQMEIKHELPK